MNKLNFTEIVPAKDSLLEEDLNQVKGGSASICLKGCISGTKDPATTKDK